MLALLDGRRSRHAGSAWLSGCSSRCSCWSARRCCSSPSWGRCSGSAAVAVDSPAHRALLRRRLAPVAGWAALAGAPVAVPLLAWQLLGPHSVRGRIFDPNLLRHGPAQPRRRARVTLLGPAAGPGRCAARRLPRAGRLPRRCCCPPRCWPGSAAAARCCTRSLFVTFLLVEVFSLGQPAAPRRRHRAAAARRAAAAAAAGGEPRQRTPRARGRAARGRARRSAGGAAAARAGHGRRVPGSSPLRRCCRCCRRSPRSPATCRRCRAAVATAMDREVPAGGVVLVLPLPRTLDTAAPMRWQHEAGYAWAMLEGYVLTGRRQRTPGAVPPPGAGRTGTSSSGGCAPTAHPPRSRSAPPCCAWGSTRSSSAGARRCRWTRRPWRTCSVRRTSRRTGSRSGWTCRRGWRR